MRFEQLVLYVPGDEFRLRFGPRVTVVSGVDQAAREDLLNTVINATAGLTGNASVVFTDHTGRRVFADGTGATYADTGEAAPTPAQLIGADPDVLLHLMALRAADLGLDGGRPLAQLRGDLVGARGAVAQLQTELESAVAAAAELDAAAVELDEIARRQELLADEQARWAWVEACRRADDRRAAIALHDDGPDTEHRLLAAVHEVRERGQAWADLATAAAERRDELGDQPPVARADVDRVAATPDQLPDGFDVRYARWQEAVAARRAAQLDADLVEQAPVAATDDPLVEALARIDQHALWTAHAAVVHATAGYEEAERHLGAVVNAVDPDVEHDIEAAHHEVVRNQRRVEQRSRPGALAAGALAASTLLAVRLAPAAGVASIVAASIVAVWLVLIPHRRLTRAVAYEATHLARAGAASWLGLHLRRLDGPADPAIRQLVEEAANAKAAAEVDWQDLVGIIEVDTATQLATAIRAHAAEIDEQARAERIEAARAAADAADAAEQAAADALTHGLSAYGIGAAIAAEQARAVLAGRIAAGRVAREWQQVFAIDDARDEATACLDELLCELDFHGDDIEDRLARVIDAVTRARARADAEGRPQDRPALEADLAALEAEIERDRRAEWIGTADPVEPPPPAAELAARRRALEAATAPQTRPDVQGARRRLDLMVCRVNELEHELGDGDGAAPLHKRLVARVARTTWQGGVEESVPILLDDPLTQVPVDQRCDLLDMLVRLSDKTQIVYLTADPVVARWARQRALDGSVTLLEPEPELDVPATAIDRPGVPLAAEV